MTRTQLQAAVSYWKTRETVAYKAWRVAVHNRPATSPTRARLYNAYEHAHTMRVQRQAQLARIRPAPVIDVDQAGLNFIADHEGVIPYAYPDSDGNATAWVGHLLHKGPPTAADYKKWGSKQHPASRAECLAYFRQDLKPYIAAVNDVFHGAKLLATHNRVDSATSFCFNIGTGGLLGSTFAKRVKAGDAKGAAAAMLEWNEPPEIRGRRHDEATLFLKEA